MAIFLEVVVVAVLAAFVLLGVRRGLILSLCGLLGVVIAFVGAGFLARTLSPMVADALEPHFAAAIEEQLNQQIEHNLGQPSIEGGGESAPGTDPLQDVLNALKGMGFYQDLIDMVNQAVENGMTGAAADVAAKAAASIAQTVAYRILYLVGFTLILILWKVVSRTLNLVARLPGIHFLNKTLGGVFGLVQGCLILFVAAWLLQLMGNLIPQETVEQTVLLKFFMTSSPLALLSAL